MNRTECIQLLTQIVKPIFAALARRQLSTQFPSEGSPFACMEAFARSLLGASAFMELGQDEELSALARQALDAATDPNSPDMMPFATPHQALVESGLIALALVQAPNALWHPLPPHVKTNIATALASSRCIPLRENNWVLFGGMVEAFMVKYGLRHDPKRLNAGIERFDQWYLGDGMYGDGPNVHFDYYNSFIIHPFLYEILSITNNTAFMQKHTMRMQRYAAIQERMIAPDGTFVPLGRSLTYRCGAFHALAFASLKCLLPQGLPPQQAKVALTRVIKRTLIDAAPSVFCERGFLTKGLSGVQPKLAENYINRGSVYMCCVAFLPLGLGGSDVFWCENEETKTSWELAWSGEDCLERDKALGYSGKSPFLYL